MAWLLKIDALCPTAEMLHEFFQYMRAFDEGHTKDGFHASVMATTETELTAEEMHRLVQVKPPFPEIFETRRDFEEGNRR